jgi:hypothetical protein
MSAPPHWIDTSVLVQSRQKYHKRERVPQFWSWLADRVEDGSILMPHEAWKEISKGNDWLAQWVKRRENTGLNSLPDQKVQDLYRKCADDVKTKWSRVPHQWVKTLDGADLWLVVHAKASNGIAVSEENKAARHETDSIKIPDVCKHFDVKWADTFLMLDTLEADFSNKSG